MINKEFNKLTPKENKKLRDEMIETVDKEVKTGGSYILLLVFSTIIAALGLIIDNTAVIIGAMLISPLFWPILGLTVSIITTRRKLTRKSSISLLFSICLVLLISIVVGILTPSTQVSDAILSRTSPTIIDLFIALASSVIGVAAIYYPRISSSVTGVAISISLLPPLAVSGLGIAYLDWDIFWGSFLLFITNMAAIIFAGVVTLYALRFRPRRGKEEERWRIGLAVSAFILVLLAVPLTLYLADTINQERVRQSVNEVLKEEVLQLSEESELKDLNVQFLPTLDSNDVKVSATIYLPEGIFLTISDQDQMIEKLVEQTGRSVDLQLSVVNTLKLRKIEDLEAREARLGLEKFITDNLKELSQTAVLDNIDIIFPEEEDGETEITLLMKDFGKTPLSFTQREELNQRINKFTGDEVILLIELVPVRRFGEVDEEDQIRMKAENTITYYLNTISNSAELNQFDIYKSINNENQVEIIATIFIPTADNIEEFDRQALEDRLEQGLGKDVTLTLQLIRYDSLGKGIDRGSRVVSEDERQINNNINLFRR